MTNSPGPSQGRKYNVTGPTRSMCHLCKVTHIEPDNVNKALTSDADDDLVACMSFLFLKFLFSFKPKELH